MTEEVPTLPTFDELRGLGKRELIYRINCYFKESEIATDRAFFPLRAQILMGELARRDQNKQANIMIGCTIGIAILTVIITAATIIPLYLVCHLPGGH